MFCLYCGEEIQEGSAFCNKCGKALEGDGSGSIARNQSQSRTKGKGKLLLFLAGVFILIGLIGFIIYNTMTGVVIVNKNIEAGTVAVTKDLIKAKSKNATVTIDGTINTDVMGEYQLKYTIQNGVFKMTKDFTFHVVDTTAPKIVGPDSVTIIAGQEFVPSDFYDVEDFETDLKEKISMVNNIDTTSDGSYDVELLVTDSSGNEGNLSINLKVLKLSTDEEMVLKAINQYIADGNSKDDILSSAWVMKTSGGSNGVDYYVEVATNVLYAIYYSGKVSEFTVLDCGGTTLHELMVYAVHYDGTLVNTAKLL